MSAAAHGAGPSPGRARKPGPRSSSRFARVRHRSGSHEPAAAGLRGLAAVAAAVLLGLPVLSAPVPARAQGEVRTGAGSGVGAGLAQELANPVANLISVPFQNNVDYGGGRGGALRYTLNVQPVVPFALDQDWNLITRTIVPLQHFERVFREHEGGLGDVVQSFFLSPSRPVNGISWGLGPVFLYPTATKDALGGRQWGAGPTGVLLQQSGPWLYGVLANHIWSLGGVPDGRERVNATFLQPFLAYTFPTQTTLSLNTESTYDWSRGRWTVPVNANANQLVQIGGQAVQFGAGLRYYAERPEGGPHWGFRLTVTLVFPR